VIFDFQPADLVDQVGRPARARPSIAIASRGFTLSYCCFHRPFAEGNVNPAFTCSKLESLASLALGSLLNRK
jgi:hypothetical protein